MQQLITSPTFSKPDRLLDSVDYFLYEICGKLQLTKTEREGAEERYEAVGGWLQEAPKPSLIYHADVSMIPHGGLGTDTATRPFRYDEFDLDLIVRMVIQGARPSPQGLYQALYQRLAEHSTYKEMIEAKTRCVRVIYAAQFHMDLMPALPLFPDSATDQRLLIPHIGIDGQMIFAIVDPIGLMKWFNDKCALERLVNKMAMDEARGDFEMMPILTDGIKKPILKHALQLVKRARDVYFKDDDDSRKILKSVLALTVAGECYTGERNLYGLVRKILTQIQHRTADRHHMRIANPIHDDEDFSLSLREKPERHEKLQSFLSSTIQGWDRLTSENLGIDQRQKLLSQLFGEVPAKAVLNEYAERTKKKNESGGLKMNSSTGNLVYAATAAPTLPVKRHEFYGD